MNFTELTDHITLDSLRSSGATKWVAGDNIIGAFVAEMDFGIAPPITQALHKAVDQGLFGYMPASFITDLQRATATMLHSRYGWQVNMSDVRPLPDVIKALELAIRHNSRPGSKIIVPTPSYMPFLIIPPMAGRDVIEVPMRFHEGLYRFDFDELQRAFDDGGHMLILCNPYNPGGRVYDREELEALSELVDRNGGRVFSDEIWAPLVYSGRSHIPYASVNSITAGHTITALSASKAWNLPGLKCAQIVTSNDADREIWDKIGFFAAHGASNLGIIASVAAYESGFEWLADTLAYLDRNRQALSALTAEFLPDVRYQQPEGTYVGWLDFRDTAIADKPAAFFKEHASVHLTEGLSCGAGFQGFARFIFATPLPIMEEAIQRMGKAMASLPRQA